MNGGVGGDYKVLVHGNFYLELHQAFVYEALLYNSNLHHYSEILRGGTLVLHGLEHY